MALNRPDNSRKLADNLNVACPVLNSSRIDISKKIQRKECHFFMNRRHQNVTHKVHLSTPMSSPFGLSFHIESNTKN